MRIDGERTDIIDVLLHKETRGNRKEKLNYLFKLCQTRQGSRALEERSKTGRISHKPPSVMGVRML